jgi:catechol 2,3-dioxygenase-like lactoylglutathione lyase family enzyme
MASRKLTFSFRAVTIACSDVERSMRFYQGVLGAVRLPTDNGVGWWYRLGSLELNLLPNATQPSPAELPTHAMTMLWLEVDDLAATAACFDRQGVAVLFLDDAFMQIADPDGLVIEVWQAQARGVR